MKRKTLATIVPIIVLCSCLRAGDAAPGYRIQLELSAADTPARRAGFIHVPERFPARTRSSCSRCRSCYWRGATFSSHSMSLVRTIWRKRG